MPQPATLTIREATTPEDLATTRALLREYAAYLNASVGAEHIDIAAYEKELAELPGVYASPSGTLLLAFVGDEPAGCIALKPLSSSRVPAPNELACEIKRLWVRPAVRGYGLGPQLVQALLERARQKGYAAIYLDTIPAAMPQANRIYERLGFQPVDRYAANPVLTAESELNVHFYRLAL